MLLVRESSWIFLPLKIAKNKSSPPQYNGGGGGGGIHSATPQTWMKIFVWYGMVGRVVCLSSFIQWKIAAKHSHISKIQVIDRLCIHIHFMGMLWTGKMKVYLSSDNIFRAVNTICNLKRTNILWYGNMC